MGVAAHLGIKLNEYDAVIRTLIPHYEALLANAAAAVDTLAPRAPLVVDLGTGTGALAATIMTVRPKARVFGMDEDPGMLAMAHKRMRRGLFTFVGNFEREAIPGCDVVSASFALHHIRTRARKLALYKKARRALSRGGMIVSADCFLASSPVLQREHRGLWLEHLEQKYSKAKAAAFLRAWAKEDVYFSLEDELGWLEAAGFATDVVYRQDSFATVVGLA
jgi:ubiquinone/menaquinone biosynthesis C-methylase UbiE